MWGLGGLIWIKVLAAAACLSSSICFHGRRRYSATVILTAVMLVDGVMTLQSLDYWYQRVNGTDPRYSRRAVLRQVFR